MKIFRYIFNTLFICFALGVIVILLSPKLPLPIAAEVKIVKSGSMEPTIMTGAAVLIVEQPSYEVGDIVTFTADGTSIPTTHRIVGTETDGGQMVFVTKGDNNEEADVAFLNADKIIGQVLFSVPYLGFIFDFARQPLGFALLIGIPALLIILDEADKLYREYRRLRAKKNDEQEIEEREQVPVLPLREGNRSREYDVKRLSFFILVAGSVLGLGHILPGTLAFQVDQEASTGNTLIASKLDTLVSPGETALILVDGQPSGEQVIFSVNLNGEYPQPHYRAQSSLIGGDPNICGAVIGSVDSPWSIAESLVSFSTEEITFEGDWPLRISLSPGTVFVDGDTCVFNLAHQFGQVTNEVGVGYTDVEHTLLSVALYHPVELRVVNTNEFLLESVTSDPDPVPMEESEDSEPVPDENQQGEGVQSEEGVEVPLPDEEEPPVEESKPEAVSDNSEETGDGQGLLVDNDPEPESQPNLEPEPVVEEPDPVPPAPEEEG